MNNLYRRLMGGTMMTQPLWAPPGGEGGGDGLEEEVEIPDLDEEELLDGNPDGNDDSSEDEEISFDDPDFLEKMFGDKDGDDDSNSDDDDDSDVDSEERQQALAKGMKDGIAAIQIPEDAIPENFDPADPKQFRDVVAAIQRSTVQDTIRIMWAPIAAAMEQTHVRMRKEIQASVRDGVGENNIQSLLAKEIPGYNRPGVKDVVKTLLGKARTKYPKDPAKAVAATKKGLQAMGIRFGASGSNPGGGARGTNAKKATDAVLDSFAKLPQMATGRPGDRLKDRLTKPKK